MLAKRCRWLVGGALIGGSAVMLAGCGARPQRPVFQVQVDEWRFGEAVGKRVVTDHYTIYTTVQDAALLERLPLFMETAYQHYASLLPGGVRASPRMTSYFFASRQQWETFTRGFAGPRAKTYLQIRSGGYTEQNTCVAYYSRRDVTLAVLAHEGLHQYVHQHFGPEVPAWLNEGLACYCENYEWPDDRPAFHPQANRFRINHLREAVVEGRLLPLRDLLGTHAGNVIAMPQASVQAYYAQAWALVMFLRHGPDARYRTGFARCLRELGTPGFAAAASAQIAATPGRELSFGEAVFCHYISEDLDRFSGSFLPYVRRLAGLTSAGAEGELPIAGVRGSDDGPMWGACDDPLAGAGGAFVGEGLCPARGGMLQGG